MAGPTVQKFGRWRVLVMGLVYMCAFKYDEEQLVGGMVPVKLGVGGTNPALIEQGLGRIIPIAGEGKIVINRRRTQIRVIAGAKSM